MTFRPIHKILIANRGEIACRIMRTARAMGYRTVAVFSGADRDALHVKLADEAVFIGPPTPQESYLNSAAILDAARRTGADVIHPGYGFLAENASFAAACESAGLIFIGPPPAVIAKMGDKAAAKAVMQAAGVPCLPGYYGGDQTDERLAAEARNLGYPLLIKAVGGGGGRGIRVIRTPDDLPDKLASARREAANAFGDDRLMLERLIEEPRHIEVQVFGDAHGNMVHLFERDCTTQRRRQKIIEEAPSPALSPALRETLTRYAVDGARAVGYRNAGTMEFIADGQMNVYFLEMNTRLQVEHPVTEMVTGIDLVEWQLRVAAGEPLPLKQEEIALCGHAIEARLCAEDPYDGFQPQTGTVLIAPKPRDDLRIDTGIEDGSEVSPFYDSLMAKMIALGSDREEATRRLASALEDEPLLGLPSNQAFLARLLRSEAFRHATLATSTLDSWIEEGAALVARPSPSDQIWTMAATLFANRERKGEWFWTGHAFDFPLDLTCGDDQRTVYYRRGRDGAISACTEGSKIALIDASLPEAIFEVEGIRRRAVAVWDGSNLHLGCFVFSETVGHDSIEEAGGDERIVSPGAGLLLKVLAEPGQIVEAGETLALIEAMKMETRVIAPRRCRITSIHAQANAQVSARAVLMEIESAPDLAHV